MRRRDGMLFCRPSVAPLLDRSIAARVPPGPGVLWDELMADVSLHALLGQPDVSQFLRRIISGGRYGNAYLFHGPAGVGKGTAALAFARAALCERVAGARTRPAEDDLFAAAGAAPSAPLDDACGECPACRKSATLQHPDLQFLFPVSGEEKELEATIGETLQAMRDDPLYVFQYEKAASIRLSMTRDLQRELAYRTYEASRRIVVIRDSRPVEMTVSEVLRANTGGIE